MKKSQSMGRISSTSAWTTSAPFTPPLKPLVPTAFTPPLNPNAPTSSTDVDNAQTPDRHTPRWLHTLQLASQTLLRVLRNAGFSILVGWLSGYCYTVGNFASGEPPAQQSYASFVTANGAWFHGVFSMTTVILYAVRLTGERYVICSSSNAAAPSGDQEPPSRKLSLMQCSLKLLWHMLPYIIFSTAAEVVGCYMLITNLPLSGRKYKPAMYMNSFWSNFVLAGAEFSTRNIFTSQTVRGLARKQLKESQLNKDGKSTRRRSSRPRRSCISSVKRFLVIYLHTLPSIVSSLIAIVYVHLISLFASINRESELVAFAIGSIALKLTMQEMAKRHLLATKTPLPRRLMIILVSTPTILVDTQVRMLLMQLQDVSISVLGSAMLALTEITVRAAKSMLVHRDVQQMITKRIVPAVASAKRRFTFNQTTHNQAPQGIESKRTPVETLSTRRATMPASDTIEETKVHHQRHLVVHAAEIYADMYAEYMAMGCSYAIMFFFWNHPQYQFVSAAVEKSEATQRRNQFIIFAFQVTVEVVVDFFACNLEALQGVDFGSFDQNDPFLTFFMSMLAFANVSISAGLYIHA